MDNQKAKNIIKYTIMGAGLALILLYISLTGIHKSRNKASLLSKEEISVFQSIDDDTKMALIGIPQDSILAHIDKADSATVLLGQLPVEKYQLVQNVLQNNHQLTYRLFIGIRFILVAFLAVVLYVKFIGTLNYRISFQKALFEATKMVLLFALLLALATVINQMVHYGTPEITTLLTGLFTQLIKMLKLGLIYGVVISAFLWFHPNNMLRLEKKQQKENQKGA
jgi:hypothetical protein